MVHGTRLLPEYSPEKCGFCDGKRVLSSKDEQPCEPCQGRGIVFVLQPPRKCPRCRGNGRPQSHRDLNYNIYYCSVCMGTGWIMTELHRSNSGTKDDGV